MCHPEEPGTWVAVKALSHGGGKQRRSNQTKRKMMVRTVSAVSPHVLMRDARTKPAKTMEIRAKRTERSICAKVG